MPSIKLQVQSKAMGPGHAGPAISPTVSPERLVSQGNGDGGSR